MAACRGGLDGAVLRGGLRAGGETAEPAVPADLTKHSTPHRVNNGRHTLLHFFSSYLFAKAETEDSEKVYQQAVKPDQPDKTLVQCYNCSFVFHLCGEKSLVFDVPPDCLGYDCYKY